LGKAESACICYAGKTAHKTKIQTVAMSWKGEKLQTNDIRRQKMGLSSLWQGEEKGGEQPSRRVKGIRRHLEKEEKDHTKPASVTVYGQSNSLPAVRAGYGTRFWQAV